MEMNRQEMTAFLEAWMTGDPEQDDAWLALQYGELFMTEKIIDLNMAVFQVLLNDVIRKNENLILAELDTGPLFDRLQDILRRSKAADLLERRYPFYDVEKYLEEDWEDWEDPDEDWTDEEDWDDPDEDPLYSEDWQRLIEAFPELESFSPLDNMEIREALWNILQNGAEPDKEWDEKFRRDPRVDAISMEYTRATRLVLEHRLEEAARSLSGLCILADIWVSELPQDEYVWLSFEEPMQILLYHALCSDTRIPQELPIRCSSIFGLYGCVLREMGRIEEARQMLQEALKWNPVDPSIYLELVGTYSDRGDVDTAFTMLRSLFRFIYRKENLGNAMLGLCWCFAARKLPRAASCCGALSVHYWPEAEESVRQILSPLEKAGMNTAAPTQEEVEACAEQYGFPLGLHPELLDLVVHTATDLLDFENRPVAALLLLEIIEPLTDSPAVLQLIDEIRKPYEDLPF